MAGEVGALMGQTWYHLAVTYGRMRVVLLVGIYVNM